LIYFNDFIYLFIYLFISSKGVQVEPIFGTDLNEIVEKSGVVSPQGTGMIPIILREMIKELMKGSFFSFFFFLFSFF